tara:strand:- start:16 stop:615 length:600 start_codon:yes stop_codon:yes gene_type:complete
MATYQNSRYNIALPTGAGGAIVPIKTLTASSSGTLSFVDGSSDVVLDNTYRTYIFKFISIHPSADANFTFQGTIDSGSNYNVTMTNTYFMANHNEGDTAAALGYEATIDQAQGTSFQRICRIGNDNDQAGSGELWLFNPSSTTYVKHFMSRISEAHPSEYIQDGFVAGYFNTTSAIDGIQFKMASGNIDSGTIKLYGIA